MKTSTCRVFRLTNRHHARAQQKNAGPRSVAGCLVRKYILSNQLYDVPYFFAGKRREREFLAGVETNSALCSRLALTFCSPADAVDVLVDHAN